MSNWEDTIKACHIRYNYKYFIYTKIIYFVDSYFIIFGCYEKIVWYRDGRLYIYKEC